MIDGVCLLNNNETQHFRTIRSYSRKSFKANRVPNRTRCPYYFDNIIIYTPQGYSYINYRLELFSHAIVVIQRRLTELCKNIILANEIKIFWHKFVLRLKLFKTKPESVIRHHHAEDELLVNLVCLHAHAHRIIFLN